MPQDFIKPRSGEEPDVDCAGISGINNWAIIKLDWPDCMMRVSVVSTESPLLVAGHTVDMHW